MDYNSTNYPELPIFLFCDIVHDFLEGPGISGDFDLDINFILYLCRNYLSPSIPPNIIDIINNGKKVKTVKTFLKNAHNYLYEICKKRGRFFMDLIYQCTANKINNVRVLGESFETIKSQFIEIERLNGTGDRANVIYRLLRLGGKSEDCPETAKSKMIYIIEDAFKSDKYFGYIYDTNRIGCERNDGDFYTPALSSVSGVYDQANSSLYTTNMFNKESQSFILYKDPGSLYYFQKLTEPVSFSINFGTPLVVSINPITKEVSYNYKNSLDTFYNLLRPSSVKSFVEQKISLNEQINTSEFIQLVDSTLSPEQLVQCKASLVFLIKNNFFNTFRLKFIEKITDQDIPTQELNILKKYLLINFNSDHSFTTYRNFINVISFRDKNIDEIPSDKKGKPKYKSDLDYDTKSKQIISMLRGVNDNTLFYLIYYNFLILDILFKNTVNIIINEIKEEAPKYPEIEMSINGQNILVEEVEVAGGISIITKTKPTVTNMKAKIRKLIVNILGPPPKEVLDDINSATSRNTELSDDLDNEEEIVSSQDSEKESNIKVGTKTYIRNCMKEFLKNPNVGTSSNILSFILAKTFGDFSQISTVLGLNLESNNKKCGFPIWFLSFDQIAALIGLYLGANTLFQSSTGTAFAYNSLILNYENYNDQANAINLDDIARLINQTKTSFGKKKLHIKSRNHF